MKQLRTRAIILKRINYGEADRILTVITPSMGKVSLLAKGARRSKSKLAGGLELFSVSDISFIDGRSELKTVVSTQLERYFGGIVEDIAATMVGYDFLKLIDASAPDQYTEEYFSLLETGFESLHLHAQEKHIIHAWFLVQFLRIHGVGINLEKQTSGDDFEEDANYIFDIDNMGFTKHLSGTFSPKHVKMLRLFGKVDRPQNLLQVGGAPELAGDLQPILLHCAKIHL